ncbi:MAG: hypothetical protein LBQ12_04365 [Deltaproteobacteria bacterium]|nr:hypothetical protein [Deltaproteobacteria bacterium]
MEYEIELAVYHVVYVREARDSREHVVLQRLAVAYGVEAFYMVGSHGLSKITARVFDCFAASRHVKSSRLTQYDNIKKEQSCKILISVKIHVDSASSLPALQSRLMSSIRSRA